MNSVSPPAEGPLVSVLIPLYNHAPYIASTLDSIHSDPYPKKEIVVLDDGSKDDSRAAALAWRSRVQPQYPCRILHQPNAGPARTVNRLLEEASGDFCALVASDDLLVPGGIQVRLDHLLAHPRLVAVFGDARVIGSDGQLLMASGLCDLYHADKRRYQSPRSLLFEIAVRWSVPGPVLLLRRKAILAMGGFAPGFLEDYDMYLRLADREQLGFVDAVVADYRLHDTNLSRSGNAAIEIRKAVLRTCWKNLPTVRPRTKVFLAMRMAISWVRLTMSRVRS
jgi:glycosyltransferase involved in cell wall biosynthesis